MSNLINKIKDKASTYKDDDTGKTGFGGLAADGQKAFKNYNEDKKDGTVDYKKQGTSVLGDLKSGFTGKGAAPGGGAPPAT